MAKISNAHPKQSGGGYERLVGDRTMAEIFTKAQSTVISNCTELEKIINDSATLIRDLNGFIDDCDAGAVPDGAYLCTKKVLKNSDYRLDGHEPDFIAFTLGRARNVCYVVELKDGDAFDTKKSAAEKEMLRIFVDHIAPKIPFRTKYYICCFNQPDKDKIVTGFKGAFSIDQVMTGEEFCQILGIDYTAIVERRRKDTQENFRYVVDKMAAIAEVREAVTKEHRKHIPVDAFYDEAESEQTDSVML